MNRSTQFFIFFSLIFLNVNSAFSQDSKQSALKKLDSIAFTSLEENTATVLDDANNLLDESLKHEPSFYQANAYTLLGIINKNRGFYVTSLDYYLKALNISEVLKDKGRISACLNNIGSIYQLQGKFDQAIDYFNQSLELEKKLKQPLQQSIRYYNLGECYKDINKLDLALTYFNNSLIIEKKEKNNEGIVYAELGIADVYIRIERYTDAFIVLKSTENRIQEDQIEEKIILHKLKGKLNQITGDTKGALQEYISGENLSKKYNIKTNLLEIIKLQIAIFESNKEWEKAARKYKEFAVLTEKMNSLHIKNQLDDLNYRNELTKKQLEIELIQEERNLAQKNEQFEKDLRIYGQKITWFVIVLLITSIGLIIFGVKKLTDIKE